MLGHQDYVSGLKIDAPIRFDQKKAKRSEENTELIVEPVFIVVLTDLMIDD